jgi:hypothetical protein
MLSAFFVNLSTFFNGLMLVLFVLVVFATFGACARRAGPLIIFSVLALFFAGTFCLFWMDLGVPSTLIHHNCRKIERSFMNNQSSIFPGIQMAGLIYKESDGFTNFDQVQDNLNNEPYIDFNELLPEQEKVFQMIRSCFWEGNADPELLDLSGLSQLLIKERDVSRRLVIIINRILVPFFSSLPEKVTPEAVSSLSWGPSATNAESMDTIEMLLQEIGSFHPSSISEPFVKTELNALTDHLSALKALIDLSDCSPLNRLYTDVIREGLCHVFIENVHSLSCFFGLLALSTVMLFFLSFCTGHRTLVRLERLEYSDYLNRRRSEEEEEIRDQFISHSDTKAECNNTLDPDHPLLLVEEEKVMPVYDQNGSPVSDLQQQQDQILDLVYVPPPIYFYGQPPQDEPSQ